MERLAENLATLIRHTTSPVILDALIAERGPATTAALARNPHLSNDAWRLLVSENAPRLSDELTCRPLTVDDLDMFLVTIGWSAPRRGQKVRLAVASAVGDAVRSLASLRNTPRANDEFMHQALADIELGTVPARNRAEPADATQTAGPAHIRACLVAADGLPDEARLYSQGLLGAAARALSPQTRYLAIDVVDAVQRRNAADGTTHHYLSVRAARAATHLTGDQLVALLGNVDTPYDHRNRGFDQRETYWQLHQLLEERPEVADAFARSGIQDLVRAALTSRHTRAGAVIDAYYNARSGRENTTDLHLRLLAARHPSGGAWEAAAGDSVTRVAEAAELTRERFAGNPVTADWHQIQDENHLLTLAERLRYPFRDGGEYVDVRYEDTATHAWSADDWTHLARHPHLPSSVANALIEGIVGPDYVDELGVPVEFMTDRPVDLLLLAARSGRPLEEWTGCFTSIYGLRPRSEEDLMRRPWAPVKGSQDQIDISDSIKLLAALIGDDLALWRRVAERISDWRDNAQDLLDYSQNLVLV